MNRIQLFLLSAVVLLLAACEETMAPTKTEGSVTEYIAAVNSPLQTFARRLSADRVEVRMPAAMEPDPSQWQPSIDDILMLQEARLVLLNGAGYSSWLNRVSLSDSRLVVTSRNDGNEWIELQGEVTHSHGPTGEHAHSGYAFTTWMDLQIAANQARAIAVALQRQWPGETDQVVRELERLLAEIDSLDRAYQQVTEKLAGRQIIYSHPVYQYFERRYGLPGLSLHWEPDVMPSPEQWQALEDLHQPGALFVWEGDPLPAIAEKMKSMGIEQVTLDPGANTAGEDWLNLQSINVESLRQVATRPL